MPVATDAVWLSVLPDMKGFGPALSKGASSEADKAGKTAGMSFGKAALAATAVIAGGAVLATKALYNIGETFDDMTDTIRVGTGATGKQLDALTNSAKNVGKRVPADFKDVGTAIADVNTRLGLTGKPLEDMTSQFLELSRITGTDVATNIKSVSRVFGDWGVATKDQSEAMDYLFKVSQQTGIGVDALSQQVVTFGAPLRQLGFDFETSAAMLGKWEKEGVNANAVLAGMKIGLGEFSKAGKDPVKAMAAVERAIKGAGSAGKANQIAIETFGQRAGPDMAAAIREGRFDLEELMGTLKGSKETILGAGKDTMDFSEHWKLFKNDVMVGLEPLATRVFSAISNGMEWIRSVGVPALKDFVGWMKENRTILLIVAGAVGALVAGLLIYNTTVKVVAASTVAWTAVQRVLNGTLMLNPIGLVVVALAALAAAVVIAYKKSETFRDIVDGAWSRIKATVSVAWNNVIKPALTAFGRFITDVLAPAIRGLWNNVIQPTFAAIGKVIRFTWDNVIRPVFNAWRAYLENVLFPVLRFLWSNVVQPTFNAVKGAISIAWNNVIKPIFQAWRSFFENVLFPVVRWLWDKVVRPVMGAVGDKIRDTWNNVIKPVFSALGEFIQEKVAPAFRTGIDAIRKIWATLKEAAAAPVRFVVNTVYNNGLRKMIGAIPGVDAPPAITLGFASGGVLPGYTPGRDVHKFYSPTAGGLELSGGEAIMRPEFARLVGGKQGVDRLNAMARKGVAHFASGGIFRPVPFGSPGGLHPENAVDIGVPVGTPVASVAAGRVTGSYDIPGYEPRAPHGGLGYRSYGRVVTIGHNGFSTLYAHLSNRAVSAGQSVAGGQVVGLSGNTGNSTGPHLHFGAPGANPYGFFGGSTNYAGGTGTANVGKRAALLAKFAEAINAAKDFAGNVGGWIKQIGGMGPMGDMFAAMTRNLVGRAGSWVDSKIPGPSLFDRGGWLMPGQAGVNLSSSPEPVFTDAQWGTLRNATRSALSSESLSANSSLLGELARMRTELSEGLTRVERAAGATGPDRAASQFGSVLNGAAAVGANRGAR